MGTVKTYALFSISQNNKIDENHECGKSVINLFDSARNCSLLKIKRIDAFEEICGS
jgi:hypothetical protein